MKTPVTEMFGVEFPLLAFSHCRDVVVAVSRAGGFGVLGAAGYDPRELEMELKWIDDHIGGKPYGVDLIVPEKFEGKGEHLDSASLLARIPPQHWEFTRRLLAQYGIDAENFQGSANDLAVANRFTDEGVEASLDVAFSHPIKFIANALGVPPQFMIDRAHREGVPIGALVGAEKHAVRQVQAGIDLLIAQSYEAGGHTGDIGGMVLTPAVIEAIRDVRRVPVVAAGGIVTGRQMAAALALGADGVWTGSVWLTTHEAETQPTVKEKFLVASASDTVRSRFRTGKPARQLRTAWHDAWESRESPGPLPMPLMGVVSQEAFRRIDAAAANGNPGAQQLASYFVGQGVTLLKARPAAEVVYAMVEEAADTLERLGKLIAASV